MKLYHGTMNKNFDGKINLKETFNKFDGLFATIDIEIAESHGNIIFYTDIKEEEILKHADATEFETAMKKIPTYLSDKYSEEDIAYAAFKDNYSLLSQEYDSDESWELQRIRGAIAKELGYKAVTMFDEHGTTYLVVDAVFKKI